MQTIINKANEDKNRRNPNATNNWTKPGDTHAERAKRNPHLKPKINPNPERSGFYAE